MKTLHLLRHAKSSWDDRDLRDIERPLSARGKKATKLMAQPLVDAGCDFEACFCSPARRAQKTIAGIGKQLPEQDIQWYTDNLLYTFNWRELLTWCQSLDDKRDEILIVGHNPALTELCNALSDANLDNLPTCGYVQMTLNTERWQLLDVGDGELLTFLYPKMF